MRLLRPFIFLRTGWSFLPHKDGRMQERRAGRMREISSGREKNLLGSPTNAASEGEPEECTLPVERMINGWISWQ
jgi:hypothetical protein